MVHPLGGSTPRIGVKTPTERRPSKGQIVHPRLITGQDVGRMWHRRGVVSPRSKYLGRPWTDRLRRSCGLSTSRIVHREHPWAMIAQVKHRKSSDASLQEEPEEIRQVGVVEPVGHDGDLDGYAGGLSSR